MQIKSLEQARSWARKHLHFNLVIVDAVGNIQVCVDQTHLRNVADAKEKAGVKAYIVRGQLSQAPEEKT
jgi:hypothetical protein